MDVKLERTTEEDILKKTGALAEFLAGAKAKNVVALDVRSTCVWTDFFVVGTYNSHGHLMGLLNELGGYLDENAWDVNTSRTQKREANEWLLIDLGQVVIHLFSEQARNFYELEKLWYTAEVIYQSS